MFIRKKVLGVSKGSLRMRNQGESRVAAFAPSKREVKASLGFGDGVASGGGFNTNISMNAMWPSEYQYYLTGILNGGDPQFNDPSALIYFYKDMYQYDATAGSAVDIQSTFPFSDFELRGLDAEKLKPFQDAVTRLNLRRMLPEISIAYLTYGYFCGSLLFDPVEKQFIDTMPHSALTCRVKNPVLYNLDPEITVRSSIAVQDLLSNGSVYTQRYLANVPRSFIELLRQGSFTLDPIATLYVPRRTIGDTAYSSYLHRIIPMYLIEKTLFRGTLSEAHKRQRAMSHITAGDDVWTPSPEELAQIVGQFQAAEFDPLGGWVSTRNAVQVTDLRPGGDFWKWYETGDSLVPYKLRALGISESFLSGDASYACLVGDTQIKQADGSSVSIRDMCPVDAKPEDLEIGKGYPLNTVIPNRISDKAQTKAWIYQGKKETFKVTTSDGHQITATGNHPFWVMQADGTCCWKRLDELKVGDRVGVEDSGEGDVAQE